MLSFSELSDPKRAAQLGIGLTSPLWGAFALTASAGMAWWAWSRWGRTALEGVGEAGPRDLIAPPAATAKTPKAERPTVEAAPEPKSFEAPHAAPKTIAEPVIDPTVAVAPPVVELAKVEANSEAAPKTAAVKPAPAKAAAPKAAAPKPVVAKADAPKPAKAAKAPSVRKPEPAAAKPRSSARRKTVRHH